MLEIANVLNLAWLGDTIALLFETASTVKLHDLLVLSEHTHKQEETAYNSTSTALSVVAVKNRHPLLVLPQEVRYLIADYEEGVEGRGLMVLPVEA